MNLKQLDYIIALDQHKHFGEASENCRVTQATLSAMIGRLEQELGIILFDRSKHPIRTTEKGVKVIELAKKMMAYKNDMLELKNQTSEKLEGTIKMAIIPTVASSLLPVVIPKISSLNPRLKLEISELTTEEMKRQLMADKVDIGILATPLEDHNFKEYALYYEPMMLYGIRENGKEYMTSSDVQNRKVWLLKEGHCFRKQAMTICNLREKQEKSNNLSFEGSSFDTLVNLADKFGGLTLIPELYYHQMTENKKNITKHFQKPFPVREISLVSHRPLIKRRAIELLSNQIQELTKEYLSTNNLKKSEMEVVQI